MSGINSSKREKDNPLALLLFAGAAVLLLLFLLGSNEEELVVARGVASKQLKTSGYEDRVNRHLQKTHSNIDINRMRAEVENFDAMNAAYKKNATFNKYENSYDLDLRYDDAGVETARELGRMRADEAIESPSDTIQAELYNQQAQSEFSKKQRRAYAAEFIENARQGGWDVKLSPDLSTVVSVKPIKNHMPSRTHTNRGSGVHSGVQ